MRGYEKGTSAAGEIQHIREAWLRASEAIHAWPDPDQAFADTTALSELGREIMNEAAAFRGYVAAYLVDSGSLTITEVAGRLGVTRPRASKIVSDARERGNPVTNTMTLPELPHVALAIITSDRGVLVEKRVDGIPPWTFPGGEIRHDEPADSALRRRVLEETGLTVQATQLIGRRIHPKTSRVMVYLHTSVEEGEPQLGDPEDLEEVRWVSIDETRDLMPDMFSPVRQYLDELARTERSSN
jgi:8-oxo-dGTP diphosphatase